MDNRSKIMNCALKLFASYGYDAVGVQRIVEEAKVTKPTLYHYFGSKKGLLEALLEKHYGEFLQNVQIAADYQNDLPLTLEKIASVYFSFSRQNPRFYRMQLSMWFAPVNSEAHLAVAAANQKQQSIIDKMFIQAGEQHGNMKGRHLAYTATFVGMLNTYIGLSLNGLVELDDQLAYRAVHQFMHGVYS